jgi:hypothetical protein
MPRVGGEQGEQEVEVRASAWLRLFLHGELAEQAGGAEEQDDDEDREGDGVFVGGPLAAVHEGLDGAEEEAAEGGAGDVADAAEDGGDEGFEAGHHAHERVDGGVIQRVEDAAGAGEGGAEGEGEGDDDVVVYADELGGFGVERDGAHRGADLRAINDELQRDHQQRGDDDDDDLVGGDDEAAEGEIGRGEDGREGARGGAEEDLAGVFEEQGHADGGDEDVERGAPRRRR